MIVEIVYSVLENKIELSDGIFLADVSQYYGIYERIENSIVNRISALNERIEIVRLPENDNDYKVPNEKPRITVTYNNSDYEETKASDIVVQNEVVNIYITIESRWLRGDKGVYQMLEALKLLLVGFAPDDCGKLKLKKFWFPFENQKRDSTWTYVAHFYCDRLTVEEEDLKSEYAITQLKFINTDTNDEITIPQS